MVILKNPKALAIITYELYHRKLRLNYKSPSNFLIVIDCRLFLKAKISSAIIMLFTNFNGL